MSRGGQEAGHLEERVRGTKGPEAIGQALAGLGLYRADSPVVKRIAEAPTGGRTRNTGKPPDL